MIGIIGQAAGLFAVTNVDDIVLLALFSAQGARLRTLAAGQYLGFAGILVVAVAAAVTFANGGDNIGVYVPVLANAMAVHVVVFLALVAVWVAGGRLLATRPVIARALSRWGHVVLPVVLIGIGLLILAEGLR